jgi:hypothetical protein
LLPNIFSREQTTSKFTFKMSTISWNTFLLYSLFLGMQCTYVTSECSPDAPLDCIRYLQPQPDTPTSAYAAVLLELSSVKGYLIGTFQPLSGGKSGVEVAVKAFALPKDQVRSKFLVQDIQIDYSVEGLMFEFD